VANRKSDDKDWFDWTVQFRVHRAWVADGFDLTDELARRMIGGALPFADGNEAQAQVVKAPKKARIEEARLDG